MANFRQTHLAVVIDNSRVQEPKAALVAPASTITPALVNRIATLSGGLFFVAISQTRADALLLSKMSRPLHSQRSATVPGSPEMYVSVEARSGVTTGISASDRAETLHVLGETIPNARKIVSPGHIFPVKVKEGGLLVKTAIPEAALDVVTLAGYSDAACFVDLLDASGDHLSEEDAALLARQNNIPSISLDILTSYLLKTKLLVEKISEAKLPTAYAGELRAITYRSTIHSGEHLVLIKGDVAPDVPMLTRVQPESTLSDVFGGTDRSRRTQIKKALEAIGKEGRGIFVYLRKPSEGLLPQEMPSPAAPQMDAMREYGIGAQILHHVGVKRIKLLTSSTKNLIGLNAFGIEITEQLPL